MARRPPPWPATGFARGTFRRDPQSRAAAAVRRFGRGRGGIGFVAVAPNRLLSGEPIGLFAACDWRISFAIAALGIALLATALVPPSRILHRAAALLAVALLLLLLAASGQAAASLATTAPALARVSLGAAFWILAGAASLAIIDSLQRAAAGTGERLAVVAIVIAGFVVMAEAGLFDALSLAREYRTREASFAAALIRHVELVAASVGAALLIGFPLGVVASRRPHWQGPVFAVLNLLQTIPSIALFGLLIVPLSALAAAAPVSRGARNRRDRAGAGHRRADPLCAAACRAQHGGRDRRGRSGSRSMRRAAWG